MSRLLPVICSKVQDLTKAAGVNLWIVDKDDLLLVQQSGEDGSVHVGDQQSAGDGIAGDVAESGEPAVFQADDPAVLERNAKHGSEIESVMAAPLLDGESLVGVLEVIGQEENGIFDEDELFTLTQVAGSAAQALHNSSLLQAERKIEVLQTNAEPRAGTSGDRRSDQHWDRHEGSSSDEIKGRQKSKCQGTQAANQRVVFSHRSR